LHIAAARVARSNAVLRSDGGGKVLAFINPITGLDRLLRMFEGVRRKWGQGWARMLEPVWIDGLPGYISRERGDVLQTTALAIEDGRIAAIYITRNPDKLRHVAQALAVAPDPTSRTH